MGQPDRILTVEIENSGCPLRLVPRIVIDFGEHCSAGTANVDGTMRLLLVEDSQRLQELLADALNPAGGVGYRLSEEHRQWPK